MTFRVLLHTPDTVTAHDVESFIKSSITGVTSVHAERGNSLMDISVDVHEVWALNFPSIARHTFSLTDFYPVTIQLSVQV